MAEVLIKAISASHSDPVKDLRGCYKRGDIVVIMPDGHSWGAMEGLPNFVVVKIPGVSHTAAQKYLAGTEGQLRRNFHIRVDDVPNAIRQELRDTGETTVSWQQVRGFIRNKVTGLDETGTSEPA